MSDAPSFVASVYASVDSMDPSRMRPYMTDDCVFRFSNMPEVRGRDAFEASAQQFYAMLSSVTHQVHQSWATDDGHLVSQVTVTYRRRDGYELTCPAAGIWRLTDGLISEYNVYVDNSSLFAQAA
ncbi:nuclear transport factor 2 family protein [Ferribacterium limneticum]|uniref:nuclear transport factor 2 family protein n=1 Tax=Ferribacterium limneticum TaxID=76259 RepID=UPI001CFB39B5|nr:nuclear transport factor 2 family protein [Ferribacterium limneticum]UCV17776.1 nuclear transport factor 2 family protein [Ferribacterium limneticum]